MTRFARTFAQLIRSGVPILEVMDIVGDTSGNYVVETGHQGRRAPTSRKATTSPSSLCRQPIFPPMLVRMVSAGEATGKIDTMLEKMADFWDEEIEAILDALTSLIEPLAHRRPRRHRRRHRHRDVPADLQAERRGLRRRSKRGDEPSGKRARWSPVTRHLHSALSKSAAKPTTTHHHRRARRGAAPRQRFSSAVTRN
mgnify:CR=1 FL=1